MPDEAFYVAKKSKSNSQNTHYLEHLRHTTLDGFQVRSKSELYIGAQLDKYGIAYRYEERIQVGKHNFYPDFIINNIWTDEPIYWEHCGKVGDKDYMKRHYEKMALYQANGIIPWKNLIVTYDDEEGNLSAPEIDLAIKGLILWMNKKKL